MAMDPALQELSEAMVNAFKHDEFFNNQYFSSNGFRFPHSLIRSRDPLPTNPDSQNGDFTVNPEDPFPSTSFNLFYEDPSSFSYPNNGNEGETPEDPEILSEISLTYISRMLLEEDIDEKVNMYQQQAALRAAEKPFYDILGEKYPPSPDPTSGSGSCMNALEALDESNPGGSSSEFPVIFHESQSAWQFRRGVDEAQKFLPSTDKLVLTMGPEESEVALLEPRGRKNSRKFVVDREDGRSNKQSALYDDNPPRSEMFDIVLLCNKMVDFKETGTLARSEPMPSGGGGQPKGQSVKKAYRGKKQRKKDAVDLRTILVNCAQAIAVDDLRTANELLKEVRQHSSPFGDGSQRLAHCFADGLEARLAGTGSQIYKSLVAKRTSASDMLKAYQLYLAACPFKRISHFLSNQTILNLAEKASSIHIIDFGIYFGFQWPSLIQRLSARPGGPPKLQITGIDVPQPGFRPTERIEETGRRLADYARSFNVPFEYNSIASKWESIVFEDLKIGKAEVLVVNCLYRFRNLVDETVIADSPRNRVLKTIRKANPDVFIHGIMNGSYSAPFFVTRFREALFHFSALFDMLEATVSREDAQRLLIERDLFGREALNVIACEGWERVERPEIYKQWQVRNLRAGFEQLPLDLEIARKARDKVKGTYHKDFVIDDDGRWLLQGWKGRIIYAISTWRPGRTEGY